jgi:putative Ig domain-containing protein
MWLRWFIRPKLPMLRTPRRLQRSGPCCRLGFERLEARNFMAVGITVTPTSGLTTTEAGGTAAFSIVLDSQPVLPVTIGLHSSDSTEGSVSTSSVTFNLLNWSTAQTITVTGVDNGSRHSNANYQIITDPASSLDLLYNGLNPADVSVTNVDPPPTISGTTATTNITDKQTATPFSSVTLADWGAGGTYTVNVTLSAAANGTLSNLAGGSYNSATGVYTLSNATLTTAQADLEGLVFTPTAHQVTPPQTVTTTFTIGISDGAATGNDSLTTVVTTSVGDAPAITSANSATFTVGAAGSFSVTASGFPAPTFTETGALPTGVTLSSAGLLGGTPGAGTGGTYTFMITAHNGSGTDATQSFTLTVDQAPTITSVNNSTFTVGAAGSFSITASGFPAPTFTETGALPSGVTLSSAGLLSGTPGGGTSGTYTFTITAHNGIGTDATQSFTLTVSGGSTTTSDKSTKVQTSGPDLSSLARWLNPATGSAGGSSSAQDSKGSAAASPPNPPAPVPNQNQNNGGSAGTSSRNNAHSESKGGNAGQTQPTLPALAFPNSPSSTLGYDLQSNQSDHGDKSVARNNHDAGRGAVDGSNNQPPAIEPARSSVPNATVQAHSSEFQTDYLWDELDTLAHKLDADPTIVGIDTDVTVELAATVSVGYAIWGLRARYLIGIALTAVPVWKDLDPLVFLRSWCGTPVKPKDDDDEDDETLQSLVKSKPAKR